MMAPPRALELQVSQRLVGVVGAAVHLGLADSVVSDLQEPWLAHAGLAAAGLDQVVL